MKKFSGISHLNGGSGLESQVMECEKTGLETPQSRVFGPAGDPAVDGSFLSRSTAGVLMFFLLGAALFWFAFLCMMISVIDEGIFHRLSIYESEPPQGWDAVKGEVIKEALPSWIIGGAIWLGIMLFVLWLAWRCALRAFGARPGIPY